MQVIYDDPAQPLECYHLSDTPATHWLFEQIMVLLQTETGRKDGYGYSMLGVETGHSEITNLPGVYITPYVNRKRLLKETILNDIIHVFSAHLRRIGKDNMIRLMESTLQNTCNRIFKYQMMQYSTFNPIDWLLQHELQDSKYLVERPVEHPSFIQEENVSTPTGNMICINHSIWIKCQSAYDGHIDKRKELCGRIGAMKLCYTKDELAKQKFFLIIDGSFTKGDIALLKTAGWDGIYYCDELALVKEAIDEALLS